MPDMDKGHNGTAQLQGFSSLTPTPTAIIDFPSPAGLTSSSAKPHRFIDVLNKAYPSFENCSQEIKVWELDVSNVLYPGPRPPSSLSQLAVEDLVKVFAFAAVTLLAVAGNASVIALVFRSRSLRNTLNYYLVNLAASDIAIAAFCAWIYLIESVTNSPWVLGAFVCKISGFLQMTALTGSTLTMTAIALDRLMAVKYPLRRMHRHCGKIIVLIWIAAIGVSVPFLVYRQLVTVKWKDFNENICMETWPRVVRWKPNGKCYLDKLWNRVYYTSVSVAMFFFPLCVMGVTYCLIGIHIWRSQMPGRSELSNPDAYESQRRETRMKVLRMVIIVMIVFCVCWAPLQFINLYAMWAHDPGKHGHFRKWYEITLLVAYCLAYSNSAINPLLYGGLNPEIRKVITQTVSALRTRMASSTNRRYEGSDGNGTNPIHSAEGTNTIALRQISSNRRHHRGGHFNGSRNGHGVDEHAATAV